MLLGIGVSTEIDQAAAFADDPALLLHQLRLAHGQSTLRESAEAKAAASPITSSGSPSPVLELDNQRAREDKERKSKSKDTGKHSKENIGKDKYDKEKGGERKEQRKKGGGVF